MFPRALPACKRGYHAGMYLGRYELLCRLATGGMGEVYLARRRGPGDIEKQVVIKKIRRELSGDPRFVDLFLSEARVSMTLSHKNIVPVFDFGRAGAELFLAMEYVSGRDLARALRAAGDEHPLSPAAVAHIGIEVCRALDYAHHRSEPIIHRDLSPKNLLLSFSGEVVVADFGLAIPAATGAALGPVRGTPAYLSPEQARGEAIDGRADLFTLGLVLREILTGEPAYGTGEPAEIITRARRAELEPLAGDVPGPLAQAINRATRVDREERFENARAMQLALDDYLIAARAAGAKPPTHELADWLETLFPDPEIRGRPLTSDRLEAVTFLDDGPAAVSVEARRLSHAVSIAETVGDSIAEAEPESEPQPEPEPPASRFWLITSGGGAVLAGIAWAIWSVTAAEPRPASVDAAPLVADAAAPVIADAAPAIVDAAPVVDAAPAIDAAARREVVASPEPGLLKVNTTRGWAQVAIPRARARCPETPCTFRLRPGRYTVEIRNPVDDSKTTRDVAIESAKTATLVVPL